MKENCVKNEQKVDTVKEYVVRREISTNDDDDENINKIGYGLE